MKSASSAASDSGQRQTQRKDEPPTEVFMEVDEGKRGALPSVTGTEHQKQNCGGNPSSRSPNEQFRRGNKEQLTGIVRKR